MTRPVGRTTGWLLLGLLSVLATSGCSIVRAEVGYGIGVGGHIKLPGLLHTGLGVGEFTHVGWHRYGGGSDPVHHAEASADLLLWHWSAIRQMETEAGQWTSDETEFFQGELKTHHACFGLLPPLTTYAGTSDGARDAWALEIGVKLLFVDFVLGINPAAGFP